MLAVAFSANGTEDRGFDSRQGVHGFFDLTHGNAVYAMLLCVFGEIKTSKKILMFAFTSHFLNLVNGFILNSSPCEYTLAEALPRSRLTAICWARTQSYDRELQRQLCKNLQHCEQPSVFSKQNRSCRIGSCLIFSSVNYVIIKINIENNSSIPVRIFLHFGWDSKPRSIPEADSMTTAPWANFK
jgi:hypothetical protein